MTTFKNSEKFQTDCWNFIADGDLKKHRELYHFVCEVIYIQPVPNGG